MYSRHLLNYWGTFVSDVLSETYQLIEGSLPTADLNSLSAVYWHVLAEWWIFILVFSLNAFYAVLKRSISGELAAVYFQIVRIHWQCSQCYLLTIETVYKQCTHRLLVADFVVYIRICISEVYSTHRHLQCFRNEKVYQWCSHGHLIDTVPCIAWNSKGKNLSPLALAFYAEIHK